MASGAAGRGGREKNTQVLENVEGKEENKEGGLS